MAFQSTLRCLENIPILGHLIAAGYACGGGRSKAERAGLKATVGFVLAPINLVAEIADEATRKRSKRLEGSGLGSRPDWMKRHHTKTLRAICLPGAHNAGTFRMSKKLKQMPLVEGWSRCQKVDVYRQLLAGVRFLDVQVMTFENEVWTYADHVRGVKLRDVLTRVRDFLSDNPTEIVIVHVTNERKSVDWTACHVIIQELFRDRLIPEHMKDLSIGDIIDQGKNIIIYGITDVAYSWQQIQYRWPNKQSPEQLGQHMRTTLAETGLYRPSCLFWYKAECTPSSPMYVRSVGGLPGLIATRYGADEKFDSVEDMAAATNFEVLHVLHGLTRLPFNILSIDYVHDSVIERIIKLNEVSDGGLRISSIDLSSDELDEVFLQPPHNMHKLFNATLNSTTLNSTQQAAMNNSYEFRGHPVPPVQHKETTM